MLAKVHGRDGVRNLKCFNQALLAKQGWRLYNGTNNLLQGVLKSRYYKNLDFMAALRGHDPSYTWRSIWGANALLHDGMRWRVGNDTSIRVWDDSWQPGKGTFIVPTPQPDSNKELRVSDLIDYDNGCRDSDLVSITFTEVDRRAVMDLPLSKFWPGDRRYWWPSPNGVYTVR